MNTTEVTLQNTACPECYHPGLNCSVTHRDVLGEKELLVEVDCPVCGYHDAQDQELEANLREDLGFEKVKSWMRDRKMDIVGSAAMLALAVFTVPLVTHYGWIWFS